jgi:hypothetical protein
MKKAPEGGWENWTLVVRSYPGRKLTFGTGVIVSPCEIETVAAAGTRLGPGDQLRHRGKIYTIWGVERYRWHDVDEALLRSRGLKGHGFVVADAAGR